MNKLLQWLKSPFTHHFPYFAFLTILSALPYVGYYISTGAFPYASFLALHCTALCYLFVLVFDLLPVFLRKFYQWVLFLVNLMVFLLDSFIVCVYSFEYRNDVISIIQGTNPNEAVEFFTSYFKPVFVVYLLLGVIALLALYCVLKKAAGFVEKRLVMPMLGMVFLGVALTAIKPEVWRNDMIGKIDNLLDTSSTPDLRPYYSHPSLTFTKENQVRNLVLIVGESFAKSHSSLYGYRYATNPRLESLRDSGSLFVFDHITSAATNTIPSFQYMMSTYRKGMNKPFYECVTLQEILDIAGYRVEWISNQNRYGIWDNGVTKYAELCDTCIFMTTYASLTDVKYDDVLIRTVSERVRENKASEDNCVYIIHLMGSHPGFDKRFPKSFGRFTADDYMDCPSHQRQKLADYDNSVLFNDSVVYDLMSLFKDEDALVLYLSDHGMDIYDSNEFYVGHAKVNEPKSVEAGLQIPFMFYSSERFGQLHPAVLSSVKDNVHRDYTSDMLIYTLMDILGIQFSDNQDVKRYSLLEK